MLYLSFKCRPLVEHLTHEGWLQVWATTNCY